MRRQLLWLSVVFLFVGASAFAQSAGPRFAANAQPECAEYRALQARLARGWNTWDTRSVTTQVLLPDGLAIRMVLRHNTALNSDAQLDDALIGRRGPGVEQAFPGPHSWDGSYTSLRLTWRGTNLQVQSAHDGNDLVLLITPGPASGKESIPATVAFEASYLWDRPGSVTFKGDHMEAVSPMRRVPLYLVGPDTHPAEVELYGPYFSASLTQVMGLSTGRRRTLAEIQAIMDRQEQAYRHSIAHPAATRTV